MKISSVISKLINHIIYSIYFFYYSITNTLALSQINYKSKPKIKGVIKIINQGYIELGNGVILNSKGFNIIGGDSKLNIITNPDGKILIGDNVGISNSTIISHNLIQIEENVLIGGGCKIYDTDFHSINAQNRMKPYLERKKDLFVKSAPIKISKNAWVGGHSIILKGVTIGQNSVLAAGSVLTRSIPDYELWGGNPAKFLRNIEK